MAVQMGKTERRGPVEMIVAPMSLDWLMIHCRKFLIAISCNLLKPFTTYRNTFVTFDHVTKHTRRISDNKDNSVFLRLRYSVS